MFESESEVSIVKLGDDINISVSQHSKIQEEFRNVWGKSENNSNYIRHKNTLDKMRAMENQNRVTNHETIEDKQYASSSTNYNIHLSTLQAKMENTKEAFKRSTCLQGLSGGIIVALIILYSIELSWVI